MASMAIPAGPVARARKTERAQRAQRTTGSPPAQVEQGFAYDRLMLVMLLFAGAIFLIAARLTHLQISADGTTSAAGIGGVPVRADIVDRNGVVLATNIEAWAIGIQPAAIIGDKADLAAKLNELMPEQSAEWYLEQLNRPVRFTYIRRNAEPQLIEAVNALGEPGITFGKEPERLYPQGMLGGHVLGWVDASGTGAAGVERAMQEQLLSDGGRGAPLALSIDSRVQAVMEEELGNAMTSLQAQGGTGIILDVDTGEVVALASGPTFNPNVPREANPESLRNNAIQSVYELGSTFKPLTVAAALDAGVTNPSERWDAVSPVMIGRHSIGDSHPAGRWLTLPEVLTKSSNIASARIGERVGIERMDAMFRNLHFHERPALELRERARTMYPTQWSRPTLLTAAFGHSVAVTPLHLANAYATLVNGGIYRPTTLLRVDRAPEGQRVFTAQTSATINQMLRLIVTNGTGRKAEAEGFRVGGKTGTAEKPGAGGYSKSVNVSTFVAAFPMDRPRYVVLVMLDAPKANAETQGQTTAGWTAAPVVSKVIARTGALLGIVPSLTQDVDVSRMAHLVEGAQEN
jgi:cell division protein FtsI (penicillin-binding protein 3)